MINGDMMVMFGESFQQAKNSNLTEKLVFDGVEFGQYWVIEIKLSPSNFTHKAIAYIETVKDDYIDCRILSYQDRYYIRSNKVTYFKLIEKINLN